MRRKNGPQAIGKSRGEWNTKIHLVAANDVHAVGFRLSPGQRGDGPEGRELIGELGCPADGCALAVDMAYQGDETRGLATLLVFRSVVRPHPQRIKPWRLDKATYHERNHVERLVRRLKGFRRIFTGYDKLDVIFRSFVTLALMWLGSFSINRLEATERYFPAKPSTVATNHHSFTGEKLAE